MSAITTPSAPSIMWGDFCPVNNWSEEPSSGGSKIKVWKVDNTTGRSYNGDDSECVIGVKFTGISIITPLTHAIASVANIAYRVVLLVSLSHFRETNNSWEESFLNAGADVARIVATPFAYIALELSALYGIIRPLDGRKLYASLERVMYGSPIQAPCMQPALHRPLSLSLRTP